MSAELLSEFPFAMTTAEPVAAKAGKKSGGKASTAAGLTLRMYRLENGLRVLLLADPSAPVLAYQTWFRVGSRHEQDGKTGLAHLFEHLMFNETEHLPAGEFDRQIERQGGSTNAATWVDWTYYQDDLPKSELELAVRLEAERMQHLVIKRHQVESERGVVISERRLRVDDDVDGFMSEELFRLAFDKGHPYQWPTIGWMRDIKRLSLRDAMTFYRTFYAPNNALLVVVGDIDEKATLALIEKHYGPIPAQALPAGHYEPLPERPPQAGERRALFKKPVQNDKLLMGYQAPAFSSHEHVALDFLSELLMGSYSSPIHRDLVVEREIVTSIGGSVTPFRDRGLWEVSASLKRGHRAEEALALFDAHIARVREHGVGSDDVERTRARLLTEFYSGMRTAHGKAAQLGEFDTVAGDYRTLFDAPAQLRAVTPAQLQAVARTYLVPERRTLLIVQPEQAEKPKTKARGKAAPQAERA
jgi:zinc protease